MKPGIPVPFCAGCPSVTDVTGLGVAELSLMELEMTELMTAELGTTELAATELIATVLGAKKAAVELSSGEYVNKGGAWVEALSASLWASAGTEDKDAASDGVTLEAVSEAAIGTGDVIKEVDKRVSGA